MTVRKLAIFANEAISALIQTASSLLSWAIGYPLTLLIKRNPGLTAVICRPGGMFADNCKYFFVFAHEMLGPRARIVLFTSDNNLARQVIEAGGEAIRHPSLRSLLVLMQSGTVVTDLYVAGCYPLTRGAKLVQLYHGAPLKHIELDIHMKRLARLHPWQQALLNAQKTILGRYPVYDLVVATSEEFIRAAFQRCFKARRFIATGYPRNDILFGWPQSGSLSWRLARISVDLKAMDCVKKARDAGQVICLYAPTFRRDYADPFAKVLDLSRLSLFARQQGILFVLKLHPFMQGRYQINQYPDLLEYDPQGDIYPLMAETDVLVTDYSSIFFDFLLLDRPIVFFPYDLEQYLNEDRQMYFDYDAMTPGAKCRTQDELEACLKTLALNGRDDGYAEMRSKVRSFAHDHVDNQSTRRLIEQCLQMN